MIIEDSIVQIFTTYLREVEIEQKGMGIAPAGSPGDLAGVLGVLAQILIVCRAMGLIPVYSVSRRADGPGP